MTDHCYYCERKFGYQKPGPECSRKPLIRTKDHIVPVSKGGNNSSYNIVYCCFDCNHLKGDLTLEEFIEKINKFISKTKATKTRYTTMLKNVRELIDLKAPIMPLLLKKAGDKRNRIQPQKLPPEQVLPFLADSWQRSFEEKRKSF